MATEKMMVKEFAWDPRYAISGVDEILTPALVVYPEIMAKNIERTIAILHGDASRWRPHIKTAKLAYTLRMFVEHGVHAFKCATTLELLVACRSGAEDVLVAYPLIGANARRVREIAEEFPHVKISVLTESAEQLAQWKDSRVGAFVDLNPGMNRTGIGETHVGEIVELVKAILASGLEFRGLHYYDGQYATAEEPERTRRTHEGYRHLLTIVDSCEKAGAKVGEVITSGTPVFRNAASFEGFAGRNFVHQVSPGTIVYSDATSLAQLPDDPEYRPAVLVLTRVVSHPRAGMATCDAGHKAVSADAGVPTCIVVGHPELNPLGPSEEHLPLAVQEGAGSPRLGDTLFLLPRHICPSVNNFNEALIVRNGHVEAVEQVSARGRETPLLGALEAGRAQKG